MWLFLFQLVLSPWRCRWACITSTSKFFPPHVSTFARASRAFHSFFLVIRWMFSGWQSGFCTSEGSALQGAGCSAACWRTHSFCRLVLLFTAHIIQELLGFGVTNEGLNLPHVTVLIDCLPFRAYKNNTLKHHSVYEIMLPLVSPVLLFALCTTWIFVSPMDILEVHPRLFYFMVGTAFANISVSSFALCFTLAPGKRVKPPMTK